MLPLYFIPFLLRRNSSDQQGIEKNLPRRATSLQMVLNPQSNLLVPWSPFHGMTHGREAEGGEGTDHGHTHVKMSLELRGESCAPDNKQNTAWAREQRKRTHFLLMARLYLSWPWAAHNGRSWCQPRLWWHWKGHHSLSNSTAAWSKGGLFHREPHVLLVLPKRAQAEAQICACQVTAPLPALSTIPCISSGQEWQHRIQSDSAWTDTLWAPHPSTSGSCDKNTSNAQQILNSWCLQRAAHRQSSSYHLIKKKH